jgi:hypothetical protein
VGQYLRDLGSAVEVEAHDGQRGTELATGRHGGHGGTSPFPVKGRRTGGANARTSTRGQGGVDLHTWIGRRGGSACCR